MELITLPLLVYFCYSNGNKAKARGLNSALWIFFTVIGFTVGLFLGAIIVTMILMSKYGILKQSDIIALADKGALTWHITFMMFAAVGGYLFIRYLLERRPLIGNSNNDHQSLE
ncbi:MAG: hypothetical protein WCG87_09005 [Bacteroidota bacterium]